MKTSDTASFAGTFPAPFIPSRKVPINPPPEPDDPKLKKEHQAYVAMFPELLKTHYGKFVAVHNGKVVGSGEDKIVVALQAYQEVGYLPIYVHLVTDQLMPLERSLMPRIGKSLSTS